MLLEFSYTNFRSFREDAALSLIATNTVSEDKDVDARNIYDCSSTGERILKVAAIYGANASGKSNIIKAARFVRNFVINSSRQGQYEDEIPVEPFLLNETNKREPSGFEMVFVVKKKKYTYGFEVDKSKVTAEWLYRNGKRKTRLFNRTQGLIELSPSLKELGGIIKPLTRDNALFLSVLAQFNEPRAIEILDWFRELQFVEPEIRANNLNFTSASLHANDDLLKAFNAVFKSFDTGVDRFSVAESSISSSRSRKSYEVKALHKVYSEDGNEIDEVEFDLVSQESDGTRKLYSILFPLVIAVTKGATIFIDELDARLHPTLTRHLMNMFINSEMCGQLIFTTHDTNLLTKELLRRDQIWFVEKTSKGESSLYSLVQYQPRNDALFGKDYLRGKYGAIPFINTAILDQKVNSLPKTTRSHSTEIEDGL